VEESAADKELAPGVCSVLPPMADPEDWSETAISAEGELPPVMETEEDSFSITPVLSTVPDPSPTSAVPESFPVDPVAPVELPPEESVVVVESSLEESISESGGEEESDADVLLEESVSESGGEEESDADVLLEESVSESGGESITRCPKPVPSAILALVLADAISTLAKNPIGYVIIERESTSIMDTANIFAADSTTLLHII
jgi:hypothetical protein